MKQVLNQTEKFPYSRSEYFKRILWFIIKWTIWKISWHRLYYLRMIILKVFGANVKLKNMVYGSVNILRPWDLQIGRLVAIGPRAHIYNLSHIKIGNNTVISQDVYLCGGTHDYTSSSLPLLRKKIVIGSGVWICAGAFIGPGVTIGDDAVIGARAVVLKDVASKTVVGGNPAKFIKKRIFKN